LKEADGTYHARALAVCPRATGLDEWRTGLSATPAHAGIFGKTSVASARNVRLTAVVIRKFVVSDPSVHDGAPLFQGTAVPVQSLIEYRQGDVPVYEFLLDHPSVKPEHAKKVARWLAATDPAAARAQLEELRSAKPASPQSQK
jgi:uncharacterized protein (DUF433 family)